MAKHVLQPEDKMARYLFREKKEFNRANGTITSSIFNNKEDLSTYRVTDICEVRAWRLGEKYVGEL
jgi:hypothetical protein